MEDIVIASFQDQSGFREGMTELRRAHENGALRVRAAAVLERRGDGTWSSDKVGASAGGVVETLLGALTGPVAEHLSSPTSKRNRTTASISPSAISAAWSSGGPGPRSAPSWTGSTRRLTPTPVTSGKPSSKTRSRKPGLTNKISNPPSLLLW